MHLSLFVLCSHKMSSINFSNRTEVIMPMQLVIRAKDGGRIRTYNTNCSIQVYILYYFFKD